MKALVQENVPLASLTTLGIGGPARYFVNASDEATVVEAVGWAKNKDLPVFVLGGGSNLLIADAGFPGLVIRIGIRGIDWTTSNGLTMVIAAAGEEWDPLVAQAIERNCAGIECLSGIPGLVGGAPVQNVGAYGQEVSEVLLSVRVYDRDRERISELSRGDCGFSYRTSIFNTTGRDRYVVLSVTLSLIPDGQPAMFYPDLIRELQEKSASPTLAEVRAAVRRIRGRKAMLLVEGDPDSRSAGSFFKNPVLTKHEFEQLQLAAGSGVPCFPVADSDKVKTAAAWLIEQAGFSKGYSAGPVGLSTKHTLAVVNKGGARAEDVLRLAREIRAGVRNRFDIELQPEPVLIGFPNGVLS